jgi:hypothetical protein
MSSRLTVAALTTLVAVSLTTSGRFAAGQPDSTGAGFVGSYRVAADKMDPSKLPHVGAWRINFEKSAPGAEKRWSSTATNIFESEKGGLRHSVFNFYPSKVDDYDTVYTDDARTYWFKLDGKNIYPNPQGPNGKGQTVAMWLIDRNTIFRERATKGVVDERVLYRISPDRRTLTWTGFNADGDSSNTVWDRIQPPAR